MKLNPAAEGQERMVEGVRPIQKGKGKFWEDAHI